MSGVSGPEKDHNSSIPTQQPAETIQGASQTPPTLPVPIPQQLHDTILTDTLILPDGQAENAGAALLHAESVVAPAPSAPSDGAQPVAPTLITTPEEAEPAHAAALLAEGAAPVLTSPLPAKPQKATQEMAAVTTDADHGEPAPEASVDAPLAEAPASAPESAAREAETTATPPEAASPAPEAPIAAKMDGAPPVSAPLAEGASSSSAAADGAPAPAPRVTKPFSELAASAPPEPVEQEPSAPVVAKTGSTGQLADAGAAPLSAPSGADTADSIPEAAAGVNRAEPVTAALPREEALTATAPVATPDAPQALAAPALPVADAAPAPVAAASPTTSEAPAGEAAATDVRACPVCGSRVREGELACSFCGHVLTLQGKTNKFDEETEVSGKKRYPTGEVLTTEQKPITLEIEGKQLTLMIAESITVGRNSDIPGDALPDVDLGAYGASESGVSRRHIRIRRKGILLYVADLNSTNGTLLNGRKLIPEGERLIRSGDEIRLGHLKIRVKF